MTLLSDIKADREAGRDGPWEWWTSNSYRRLKVGGLGRKSGDNVLEGYVCADGCADLVILEADMRRLARVPELEKIALAADKVLESGERHLSTLTAYLHEPNGEGNATRSLFAQEDFKKALAHLRTLLGET